MKIVNLKKFFFIVLTGVFLIFMLGCENNSKSNSSKSSTSKKSKTASYKTCRCGSEFSHSGYRIGWGDNGYGMNDKIGVKPGPNCSEYCAFRFENY